jgi:hypothetical protein
MRYALSSWGSNQNTAAVPNLCCPLSHCSSAFFLLTALQAVALHAGQLGLQPQHCSCAQPVPYRIKQSTNHKPHHATFCCQRFAGRCATRWAAGAVTAASSLGTAPTGRSAPTTGRQHAAPLITNPACPATEAPAALARAVSQVDWLCCVALELRADADAGCYSRGCSRVPKHTNVFIMLFVLQALVLVVAAMPATSCHPTQPSSLRVTRTLRTT